MREPSEVSVMYIGVIEVECPECEHRIRLGGLEDRGSVVVCQACKAEILVTDDADFEVDEDLAQSGPSLD